jgi:quinoprotein glucose dehydrogenase
MQNWKRRWTRGNDSAVVRFVRLLLLGTLSACATQSSGVHGQDRSDWPMYGGDAGGTRFSPLAQISRTNVSRLHAVWTTHTGDVSDGADGRGRTGFEATPILAAGTLYVSTGFNRVIALNPENGAQLWSYDPHIDRTVSYGDGLINRGVSSWLDPQGSSVSPCHQRIFEATLDARLIALDSKTGAPCQGFGTSGIVTLRDVPGFRAGDYHMTSPPAVIDDVVIVGSSINDNTRTDEPSGVVRAFDARSGTLRWTWDPLVRPPGTSSGWRTGSANAWSVMVTDPVRHLVFVPTGSASPDYFGGLRPGDNKWANSIVALRSRTGQMAWGFQLVHHDLWDYDTAAPPLLATIARNGRQTPVVIQSNKTGFVYVLHRETGEPVLPIEERPVPKSDVPGETASPSQPYPITLPALAAQQFLDSDVWGATPDDLAACRAILQGVRNEGVFTPPDRKGTIVVPGNVGGPNWSGYALDPDRMLLIANVNNLPALVKLIPRTDFDQMSSRPAGEYGRQEGTPFVLFRRFLQAPSGLPCTRPPWGSLVALDLNSGTIKWQVPLGSMESFGTAKTAIPPGSISLGGPIVTAGGLVFIAGTIDPYLRAFDIDSGRELWRGLLPASGHATPMTYRSSTGKQYVVVAAGGHSKIVEERVGDALVAFGVDN